MDEHLLPSIHLGRRVLSCPVRRVMSCPVRPLRHGGSHFVFTKWLPPWRKGRITCLWIKSVFDCLTIGIIHETMVVHMTWVRTFFNNYSNHPRMCVLSTLCGNVDKHSPFDIYIYIYKTYHNSCQISMVNEKYSITWVIVVLGIIVIKAFCAGLGIFQKNSAIFLVGSLSGHGVVLEPSITKILNQNT